MALSCLQPALAGGAATRVLVIAAAQDTAGVFRALSLPELGRRALLWPEGILTLAESLPWLDDGDAGLQFTLGDPPLTGIGSGGRFDIRPGRYGLDTPLWLSDGHVALFVTAGTIEVTEDRITYERPPDRAKRPDGKRGEYYILAGLVLATAMLLRAAYRRTRRS